MGGNHLTDMPLSDLIGVQPVTPAGRLMSQRTLAHSFGMQGLLLRITPSAGTSCSAYTIFSQLAAFSQQVDFTVEATAKQHNITVDNPSTASMEEEKVKPVSLGERKNYPFKGFNILDKAPKTLTKLINDYSEWIGDGFLKHHAGKDSGLFVAAYAEYLSDGLQVPNDELDFKLLRKIYAALLWKYEEAKAQKSYTNDLKDP
ncbi:hypothetical protein BC332_10831 [Capsicum chinense]|nr:hypothetical protein BC332_10831 [Capsicum chinense]